MPAPSGISWSSIQNSFHRLGIYVILSNTDTKTTVTIETWLWTKWTLKDSNNTYYFDNNATSAITAIKTNVNISHTTSSGDGWSENNQTKIATHSYSFDRATANKNVSCAAKLGPIGSSESYVTHAVSYTIPAVETYIISYNANGGMNAPSNQSKWHGTDVVISSMVPVREGYLFLGWATTASAATPNYIPGGQYSTDDSVTLYAVWDALIYTVTYDANGGTYTGNPPEVQTKTHNQNLTLTSITPIRARYTFVGWGVSPTSTESQYSSGGIYTSNTSVTLYAIWELSYYRPAITISNLSRADLNGTVNEEGAYITLYIAWTAKVLTEALIIEWRAIGDSEWTSHTRTINAKTGSLRVLGLGAGNISPDKTYEIRVTVTDEIDSSSIHRTLPGIAYSIDFKSGGKGAAFGKPAETDNLLDINWDTKVRGQIEAENATIEGSLVGNSAEFTRADIVEGLTAGSATISDLYDKYGTKLTNGLTMYESAGIDPDTTLDHLILTNKNTPNGGFMYIKTEFYSSKTETSNRMQTASPYNTAGSPYYRYYYNGAWSEWTKIVIPTTLSSPEKLIWQQDSATATTTSTAAAIYTWTADEDGVYGIAGSFGWAGNSNGIRAAYIRVTNYTSSSYKDVAYIRQYAYGASTVYQNPSGYIRLKKGHTVVLYAWQDSGATLNVTYKKFQIVKIGL